MARISSDHNLAGIHPALAHQWHPTRNVSLTPTLVNSYRGFVQPVANGSILSPSGLNLVPAPYKIRLSIVEFSGFVSTQVVLTKEHGLLSHKDVSKAMIWTHVERRSN
jgi:hypothetical protein